MTSPIIDYDIWRRDIILAPALISHGAGATQCGDVVIVRIVRAQGCSGTFGWQFLWRGLLRCCKQRPWCCCCCCCCHPTVARVVAAQWATAATPPSCQLPCVGPTSPHPATALCSTDAGCGHWDLLRWSQNRAAAVSPTPGRSIPGSYIFNNNYK